MSSEGIHIALTQERREFLEMKLRKYEGKLTFDPAYAAPELRGGSEDWYAYYMTWLVLEKGYFNSNELLAAVINQVQTYFDQEYYDNRSGVLVDYLLNNGKNTTRK